MVSRVDRVSSSVGGEPLSRSATSFDGIRRCSVVEGGWAVSSDFFATIKKKQLKSQVVAMPGGTVDVVVARPARRKKKQTNRRIRGIDNARR